MSKSNYVVYEPLLDGENDDGINENKISDRNLSLRWWACAVFTQAVLIAIYTVVSLTLIRKSVADSVPDLHGEFSVFNRVFLSPSCIALTILL